MAGSVNKVIIIGHLGANPEIKYLPSGQAVCEMRVATSERWTDKQTNQPQERTEWHRIAVWGKTAENCAKFLAKGRQVYVEGRLQTRSWDDKDGNKRYSTEIVGDQVVFLGGGGGGAGAGQGGGPGPGDEMSAPPRSSGSGAYGRGGGGYAGGGGYGGAPQGGPPQGQGGPPQGGYGGAPQGGYGGAPQGGYGGAPQGGYGGAPQGGQPARGRPAPAGGDVPPQEDFGSGGDDDIPF